MDCICGLMYVEPSRHLWEETNLIVLIIVNVSFI